MNIKVELLERARLARGLVNALGYDIECVYSDAQSYDVESVEESLTEVNTTLTRLHEELNIANKLIQAYKDEPRKIIFRENYHLYSER